MTPTPSSFESLLASGAALFGQGARLLKLRFSENSGIPEDALLPHRVHGEESLSKNYRYTLEGLSADTHLELKTFLGQPVELSLLLPDGGERLLTGLITRAEQLIGQLGKSRRGDPPSSLVSRNSRQREIRSFRYVI